ncbi:MAG: hypothetical protein H0Z37_10320 [Firmicutes bacterium]|nr:hypothetical protein [Bacillota bacterium]
MAGHTDPLATAARLAYWVGQLAGWVMRCEGCPAAGPATGEAFRDESGGEPRAPAGRTESLSQVLAGLLTDVLQLAEHYGWRVESEDFQLVRRVPARPIRVAGLDSDGTRGR